MLSTAETISKSIKSMEECRDCKHLGFELCRKSAIPFCMLRHFDQPCNYEKRGENERTCK